MVHLTQTASKQRSERRIAVRLPLRVRGRDSRGVIFEEETSSENLCRSGAAFVTRFDVAIGSDLEIRIPFSNYASRRTEADFATSGRVVHVVDAPNQGERLVGVQFTGPRFQRVFRPENDKIRGIVCVASSFVLGYLRVRAERPGQLHSSDGSTVRFFRGNH